VGDKGSKLTMEGGEKKERKIAAAASVYLSPTHRCSDVTL